MQKLLFTGDALLIEGCGRTDFQSGDAGALYNSIHNKLFSLPDETLFEAHPGFYVTRNRGERGRSPASAADSA